MTAEMLCERCADAIRDKDPEAIFPLGSGAEAFGPDSLFVKGGAEILKAGGFLCDSCDQLVGLDDEVALHLFNSDARTTSNN